MMNSMDFIFGEDYIAGNTNNFAAIRKHRANINLFFQVGNQFSFGINIINQPY